MRTAKVGENLSLERLTFVYGALRSGTTLFRLMLDANEHVSNLGEADYLFDYLRSEGDRLAFDIESLRNDRNFQDFKLQIPTSVSGPDITRNFVDQLLRRAPGQFTLNIHRHIDKVIECFPGTRIIHIVRDPRDVAKSSIGMGWASNTYFGVDHWCKTECDWDKVRSSIDDDRVCELFFEDLIANPTKELTRVCEFLSVPFSERMLAYSEYTPFGPPDRSAIQRWKKFPPRDIALVELRAKELLRERGYELSGQPLTEPSLGEKVALIWQNRLFKWRFRLKRYGYLNYPMEVVTRRVSKPLHAVFVQRMNDIDRARHAARAARAARTRP